MREAENRLFRQTCLWWVLLFALSMTGMLYVAQHKSLAAERESAENAQNTEVGRTYRMCVVIDPLAPEGETPSEEAESAADDETVNTDALTESGYDDVALTVAERVAATLADSDIRVRLTRKDADGLSVEERESLTEAAGADYYICLGVSSAAEAETYGICGYYNAEYFLPKLSNAAFADLLVRSVTLAVSDRAVGLYAAGEDSVLAELQLPAAQVNLGYVTNDTEYTLMRQDAYQDKLATGIADVLLGLLEEQTE